MEIYKNKDNRKNQQLQRIKNKEKDHKDYYTLAPDCHSVILFSNNLLYLPHPMLYISSPKTILRLSFLRLFLYSLPFILYPLTSTLYPLPPISYLQDNIPTTKQDKTTTTFTKRNFLHKIPAIFSIINCKDITLKQHTSLSLCHSQHYLLLRGTT